MANYYFNGVLLPELPDETLMEAFPYRYIFTNTNKTAFLLVVMDKRLAYRPASATSNVMYLYWGQNGGSETITYKMSELTSISDNPIGEWEDFTVETNTTAWQQKMTDSGIVLLWSNVDVVDVSSVLYGVNYYDFKTYYKTSELIPENEEYFRIKRSTMLKITDALRANTKGTETIITTDIPSIIYEISGNGFLTEIVQCNTLSWGEYMDLESYDETILYEVAESDGRIIKLGWCGNYLWEMQWDDEYTGSKLLETYPYFYVTHKSSAGVYNVFFTTKGYTMWNTSDDRVAYADVHYQLTSLEDVEKLIWGVDYYNKLTPTGISGTITLKNVGDTAFSVYGNFSDYKLEGESIGDAGGVRYNYPDNPTA